jgi:hypothetical protein
MHKSNAHASPSCISINSSGESSDNMNRLPDFFDKSQYKGIQPFSQIADTSSNSAQPNVLDGLNLGNKLLQDPEEAKQVLLAVVAERDRCQAEERLASLRLKKAVNLVHLCGADLRNATEQLDEVESRLQKVKNIIEHSGN